MNENIKKYRKSIINLEKLNTLNEEGCPACGKKFNRGDPVVIACGTWKGGKKFIYEYEAVYDTKSGSYIKRGC